MGATHYIMLTTHVPNQYARIAAVGAVSMTFAVLYLRYHYFSDALVAIIVLVPTGSYTGRLLPYQMQV